MPDLRDRSSALRLIITADDFGLTEEVNEAVEQAHRSGILTGASLMMTGAAVNDAVTRARRNPSLRVGLHVVTVDSGTVLPRDTVREIVDARGRLSGDLFAAGIRYFFRPAARRALRAEVLAQFEAFRATGLVLDHVDTHHHMVLHPTVLGIILEIAPRFDVRAIRLPSEPWRASRGSPLVRRLAAAIRRIGLTPWIALVRLRLNRAGIRHNSEVRGLADTGSMDEATVLRLLDTVDRDDTEMFFHPASASSAPGSASCLAARQRAELDALCSPRVRAAMQRIGMVRVGYGDLR